MICSKKRNLIRICLNINCRLLCMQPSGLLIIILNHFTNYCLQKTLIGSSINFNLMLSHQYVTNVNFIHILKNKYKTWQFKDILKARNRGGRNWRNLASGDYLYIDVYITLHQCNPWNIPTKTIVVVIFLHKESMYEKGQCYNYNQKTIPRNRKSTVKINHFKK